MLTIALISESEKADAATLRLIAPPLEENLLHSWEAWRPYLPHWIADAPPTVVQWDDEPLPPWGDTSQNGRCVPMYFVDSLSRNPNTLAVHYVQGNRPASRVYVEAATGINNGHASVMELAGHEGGEIEGNPWLEFWEILPGRPGTFTPRELCDAVQDAYGASTSDPSGKPWQLANFVKPAYFGLPNVPGTAGGEFDHRGTLREPGTIGPEGYLLTRDDDWNVRTEYGSKFAGDRAHPGKPEGRTRAIMHQCSLQQLARQHGAVTA